MVTCQANTLTATYRGLGRRHDALNVVEAVSVGGGQLTITTYTSGGEHYTGMIGTEGKFERRFGYWEARLRFEGAPGMWSAFWIQTPTFGRPAGDPATAGMEIDVIEHRVSDKSGKDISGPAHHAVHIGGAKSQSYVTDDLKLGSGFHTFGVQWTPTEYSFFVDGKRTWMVTPVSNRPEYIILSSEVQDKSWAGAIPADGYGPTGVQQDQNDRGLHPLLRAPARHGTEAVSCSITRPSSGMNGGPEAAMRNIVDGRPSGDCDGDELRSADLRTRR